MKYLSRPEELILLAVWKLKDQAYGVRIRKHIQEMTGKYWSIGAVYVPLDRLEDKGFVRSIRADPTPERGGKSKRFYALTPTGISQLEEVRRIYQSVWKDMPEFSL